MTLYLECWTLKLYLGVASGAIVPLVLQGQEEQVLMAFTLVESSIGGLLIGVSSILFGDIMVPNIE